MRSSIKSGRFFHTRLRVHYSWVLAFLVIVWAITTQFSTDNPFWFRIASGIIASVFFFVVVVIRELILILIARYKGVNIERVTLFAFGGLIEANQETMSPAHETILAISGILGNLAITGIFYLVYILLSGTGLIIINVIAKGLAFLYFTLTMFHFLPAYPLEGGRVFRAVLWKLSNDRRRAPHIACWTSWAFGIVIALAGILLLIFTIERFTGVFLVAIGLILQNAATHGRRQLTTTKVSISTEGIKEP